MGYSSHYTVLFLDFLALVTVVLEAMIATVTKLRLDSLCTKILMFNIHPSSWAFSTFADELCSDTYVIVTVRGGHLDPYYILDRVSILDI